MTVSCFLKHGNKDKALTHNKNKPYITAEDKWKNGQFEV